ncbi:uncharacterized protein KQ657_001313 [Scheffersomyces spartinae]|uniref:Uncharacterized protein n=1 Tax=Scheffersomyces spartinae TaxID=45513 RepID=A0A9P7V7V8_9ASCO|nr:uncharacterized protein KQ657_001313 [Scheffersomyces spartinae]KAG7192856.1 hypothetical protein KQ657_001313 [Scheffersomyces spartinae]
MKLQVLVLALAVTTECRMVVDLNGMLEKGLIKGEEILLAKKEPLERVRIDFERNRKDQVRDKFREQRREKLSKKHSN